MEITQRELTLQKIIKNQESRILELERLISLPPTMTNQKALFRQKQRQFQELKHKLHLKQKENGMLKDQLVQIRGQIKQDKQEKVNIAILTKQRDDYMKQLSQLNIKLKDQIASSQTALSNNQKQIQKLQKTNKTLSKQCSTYKQNMMSIELEIQKLQIFYRSSINELPKRKQTLTWVGNLIKFIDKYQQLLKQHPLQKEYQYLKKPLQQLQKVMHECSEEIRQSLNERSQQMKKLKDQIFTVISQTNKKYDQILDQNKIFWEEIKKQKIAKSSEAQRKLDEENKKMKQQYEIRYNQILKQFKVVEQQKRQIVLAIQQLKSYYESRQKNFKDQISLLKKTEMKMIQCSQKRQVIFQQQILRLSSEVGYLGKLYEDSLQNNARCQRQFMENEMRTSKQVMTPKTKAQLKQIISLLKQKQTHLQKQMSFLSQQQLRGLQIVKASCDNLIILQNKFVEMLGSFKSQQNEQQDDGQELNVDVMRFEQLEERKNYQISLVKKKNQRLQQLVTRLQDKMKVDSSCSDYQITSSLKQRIQQLQDQKQILQESNEKYKKKFNNSLKKLAKLSTQRTKDIFFSNIQMISSEIQRIQSTQYQQLLPLIREQTLKQQQYAETIESNLKRIIEIVEQPFGHLIRKQQPKINSNIPRVVEVTVNFSQQIREYKQLLEQRVSTVPNSKINKVLTDLITNIRATLPQRQSNRTTARQTQNNAYDKKVSKVRTPMQQKMRDLQNNRIVDKNELSKGLQKVQYFLKKIDIGRHAMNRSADILGKIQSSLSKVTNQIGDILQKPLIQKQFRQLTGISKSAISDLESKLKQSVYQNQGLIKQFKLINSLQNIKASTQRQHNDS